RLVQADIDGSQKISEIRKINNLSEKSFDVRFARNGKMINILIQSVQAEKVILHIYDQQGRMVDTKDWAISQGFSQYQVQLPNGLYIMKVTRVNKESIVQRVLVE
ncbi:MAG TPA: T9SS type A sorting domain-containing protein, partial [Flavisolibacter sp.]|nr:T9SS type A sorting domain-containing protein [Flavisolibacter sp.]